VPFRPDKCKPQAKIIDLSALSTISSR